MTDRIRHNSVYGKQQDFHFHIWWACRQRPFYSAEQCMSVRHTNEYDALTHVLVSPKGGPSLHPGDCCYIISWEFLPDGWEHPF